MRLTDESVREGRHLTPDERIALQAEEIKRLYQENEKLRAFVPQKGEIIVDAEQLRQLQAQMGALKAALALHHSMVLSGEHETEFSEAIFRNAISDTTDYHNPADVEALKQAREALTQAKIFVEDTRCRCDEIATCERCIEISEINETLAEIYKQIGGKEDA